ncbi:hypothetical protein [Desulfofustis limnaeus]|uniref:Uncharacterized protein n=1 Tax=Desulfofustis limnaeus TaxID=2740163 RepID=A0ABN6M8M5_9BACT|nr:hypothetical protein [Desulfofustis limnaeus]MDX9895106.1 hypothetical protein [Desulfofustis sp.]BDD88116.1 hypothetical protein DPPLL_24810 [Desulfofustis limnaeus]
MTRSELHRQVAGNCWRYIEELGDQAAAWGEKSLSRLRSGDWAGAQDALYYYAAYLERPIASGTMPWRPVLDALRYGSMGGWAKILHIHTTGRLPMEMAHLSCTADH